MSPLPVFFAAFCACLLLFSLPALCELFAAEAFAASHPILAIAFARSSSSPQITAMISPFQLAAKLAQLRSTAQACNDGVVSRNAEIISFCVC